MLHPIQPISTTWHIYAPDLATSSRWYSALLGYEPTAEAAGVRFALGTHSILLSPQGSRGMFGLSVSSIEEAQLRLTQLGAVGEETLGQTAAFEDLFASFHDPAGNEVLVAVV